MGSSPSSNDIPPSNASYSKIVLTGNTEEVEQASLSLFEAGCLGIEEKNKSTFEAHFPSSFDLAALVFSLSRRFPNLRFGTIESIPDRDWLAAWKRDYHAFPLSERFFIVPSWESPPETQRLVLRIDPERAFGTGTHETTRLSIELIEEVVSSGTSAIDVGTGTGVLAMACAALGCRRVLAIENDQDAAACALANIRRNGFEDKIRIRVASILEVDPSPVKIVIANLNETILRSALTHLSSWVLPEGKMILSGLLRDQVDPMVKELPLHFDLVKSCTAGDWAALLIAARSHA
jgi:ribosomal protein L11 methyltransferase